MKITKTINIPLKQGVNLSGELVSLEFISFDQFTKRYTLGRKIIFLAQDDLEGLDLIEIGRRS